MDLYDTPPKVNGPMMYLSLYLLTKLDRFLFSTYITTLLYYIITPKQWQSDLNIGGVVRTDDNYA